MPKPGDTKIQLRRTFLGFWEWRVGSYTSSLGGPWTWKIIHTGEWYHWTRGTALKSAQRHVNERWWHDAG